MDYLKHIIGEFRQNPLPLWLSIAGTALAIFTVMVVFIISELPEVEVKPESGRKSLLIGFVMDFVGEDGSEDLFSGFSKKWGENLYGNLEGIDKTSFFSVDRADVSVPGKPVRGMSIRHADDQYWNLFDFDFISGRPYTREENEVEMKVAVLPERTARILFGTSEALDREFYVNNIPYKVIGVVKDVNPLFTFAYGDIYLPMKYGPSWASQDWMAEYGGMGMVALLKKPGVSDDEIKAQVKARFDMANSNIKKNKYELVWHQTPYNIEEYRSIKNVGESPDTASARRLHWLIYTVLLLIPAINLSGMSRSRLRRRVSEIGVRRAFGATRVEVIMQLLGENFCVTLLGGLFGLILSMLAVSFFANIFFNMIGGYGVSDYQASALPTLEMIFSWRVFGFAILFCFFLNLFSSGIPVWKAASVNPAAAISGNEDSAR